MRRSRGQKLYDCTDQIQSLHFLWVIFFLNFCFHKWGQNTNKIKRYRKRSIFGWELGRKQSQNRQVEMEDVYVHFIRQKDSEWSGEWVSSFMRLQLVNKKTIWPLFKGLWQLCKSISDISPRAFAHVLSLCHISVIFEVISNIFLIIAFVMVVCVQWYCEHF